MQLLLDFVRISEGWQWHPGFPASVVPSLSNLRNLAQVAQLVRAFHFWSLVQVQPCVCNYVLYREVARVFMVSSKAEA